jgi:hypothetical protein
LSRRRAPQTGCLWRAARCSCSGLPRINALLGFGVVRNNLSALFKEETCFHMSRIAIDASYEALIHIQVAI